MSIINCGGNVESGLPDTTSASAGDVLTLDSNKDAVWQTPSGGDDYDIVVTPFVKEYYGEFSTNTISANTYGQYYSLGYLSRKSIDGNTKDSFQTEDIKIINVSDNTIIKARLPKYTTQTLVYNSALYCLQKYDSISGLGNAIKNAFTIKSDFSGKIEYLIVPTGQGIFTPHNNPTGTLTVVLV